MREFHGKYRESLLGAFWSAANPLTMIVIYTVIFGQLMGNTLAGHEKTPYAFSIYLCSGVITWNLFSEILGRLNNVFLDNGNLIKKANFPRICLPVIVTISALINFGILMTIYVIFLLVIGHWPGWSLLGFFPLLALQILFAIGLGVFLGTLNVFFRDVGQFTGVVLQFWFWLTPIVYTWPSLPEKARAILQFNPMKPLIQGYQQIFLDKQFPALQGMLPLAVVTLVFLALGAYFFMSRVGELVDEL